MKILFAYRAINNVTGGLERMSSLIMNAMASKGHEVHFLTLDEKNAKNYYSFDPSITWHKLDIGNHKQKASWPLRFKRHVKMRTIIKTIQPDIIVAFQDGNFFSMIASSIGLGIPTLLSERISPQHFDYTKKGKWKNLRYQTYRAAHKILIQCESYKPLYPKYLRDKLITISNPVIPAKRCAKPEGKDTKRKILLCAGRLCYQKNQDILIEAFKELAPEHPDWDLVLAGDGEHETRLKDLAAEHKQIIFKGAVKDIAALYASAHLFCLPSRWEGFPNALSEALAHGLPSVGYAQCGGVRDLIHHGENGLLADGALEKAPLKNALGTLMQNDTARAAMGQNAIQSVQQYKPDEIFALWDKTLQDNAKKA